MTKEEFMTVYILNRAKTSLKLFGEDVAYEAAKAWCELQRQLK